MASVSRRRTTNDEVPETDQYLPDDAEDEGDDVEEEAPRRRRGSSRPAGRRDSSRPSGRGRADRPSNRPVLERGWKTITDAKGFSENLKFDEGEVLLKFLEEDPFAAFRQHWLKEAQGRKSFNCLGEGCPLCDALGDEPRWQALFNVVDLTDSDKPAVKTWAMGRKLAMKLEKLSQKARTSPLNRKDLYWSVERTGKGLTTDYTLEAVVADDLEEYYETTPLTDQEISEFMEQCADGSSVQYDSMSALEDVVEAVS